jgi:hypothetical protein
MSFSKRLLISSSAQKALFCAYLDPVLFLPHKPSLFSRHQYTQFNTVRLYRMGFGVIMLLFILFLSIIVFSLKENAFTKVSFNESITALSKDDDRYF